MPKYISNVVFFEVFREEKEAIYRFLPKNIKSVQIIEDIDNEILAEYEVFEAGIYSKLIVQHTIYPYYEHTMEVMDGDAKGGAALSVKDVIGKSIKFIGTGESIDDLDEWKKKHDDLKKLRKNDVTKKLRKLMNHHNRLNGDS